MCVGGSNDDDSIAVIVNFNFGMSIDKVHFGLICKILNQSDKI